MSDTDGLERRYRRLLKCFPAAYRREHEQEIVSVLMDGAKEGQRRPGLADSADLVLSSIFIRWRELTRQPRWRWERLLVGSADLHAGSPALLPCLPDAARHPKLGVTAG
jgi:hypothetical protein